MTVQTLGDGKLHPANIMLIWTVNSASVWQIYLEAVVDGVQGDVIHNLALQLSGETSTGSSTRTGSKGDPQIMEEITRMNSLWTQAFTSGNGTGVSAYCKCTK